MLSDPTRGRSTWNSRAARPGAAATTALPRRFRTIRPVPARKAADWRFVVAAPPREVFAVMEQAIGTPPYRYEVTGDDSAQIVEFTRNSLVGHWRRVDENRRVLGRARPAVRTQRWVRVRAVATDAG